MRWVCGFREPSTPWAPHSRCRSSSSEGRAAPFTTLRTVTITSPRGYFDLHLSFPASGTVRLAWSYPANDPLLDAGPDDAGRS